MTDLHDYRLPVPAGFGNAQDADASRERAIRILTDAYAYDQITDFEFERRLQTLGAAASPSSIDAVVADLSAQGRAGWGPVSAYGLHAPAEGRIVGIMSEKRRSGPWRVPQHLTVRAVMCDMKIDLRHAAIPARCTIEVTAVMSSVSLIVPPGLIVDFNVDPLLGAAGCDAEDSMIAGGAQVEILGTAFMSEVRVRVRNLAR